MGKFSPEQVKILKQSRFIESVDENSITYGDLFKNEFYRLTSHGSEAKKIFSELGVDPEIVGDDEIQRFVEKMKDYQPLLNKNGEPKSADEMFEELDEEIRQLRAEKNFLMKKRMIDLGIPYRPEPKSPKGKNKRKK